MQIQRVSPLLHVAHWRQRVRIAIHIARREFKLLTAAADQPTVDTSQLAIHGWCLLRDGQREQARRYFRAALHHNPYAVGAWLGLSRAVDTLEERWACLQAAIELEYLVNRRE